MFAKRLNLRTLQELWLVVARAASNVVDSDDDYDSAASESLNKDEYGTPATFQAVAVLCHSWSPALQASVANF